MKYKRNEILFKMIFCAIMAAFAIVLDKFLSFKSFELKFTLYGLPLMFVGIMFGWKYGLLSGFVTGLVLQLTSEYGITITAPFWALAPVAWGFFSGLISDLCKKNIKIWHMIIIVLASSIMAFLMNTLAMFTETLFFADSYYTATVILTGVPARLLSMIILCPFYIVILYTLYRTLKKTMIDKYDESLNEVEDLDAEEK